MIVNILYLLYLLYGIPLLTELKVCYNIGILKAKATKAVDPKVEGLKEKKHRCAETAKEVFIDVLDLRISDI